jgi:hypothetical protein
MIALCACMYVCVYNVWMHRKTGGTIKKDDAYAQESERKEYHYAHDARLSKLELQLLIMVQVLLTCE